MTFSCIKFKKKFKMKFSLTNGNTSGCGGHGEKNDDGDMSSGGCGGGFMVGGDRSDLGVKEPPASSSSSAASSSSSSASASSTSRSSSVASATVMVATSSAAPAAGAARTSGGGGAASYSGLSRDIDLNTSTTGLCRTSSSPNETVTNSYDVSGATSSGAAVVLNSNGKIGGGKGKKANNKRFRLKKKPKKNSG